MKLFHVTYNDNFERLVMLLIGMLQVAAGVVLIKGSWLVSGPYVKELLAVSFATVCISAYGNLKVGVTGIRNLYGDYTITDKSSTL